VRAKENGTRNKLMLVDARDDKFRV